MEVIKSMIRAGAGTAMTELEFFRQEIDRWKSSPERQAQITGDKYYRGRHDILDRTRTVIGQDGKLEDVHNLPNNKIIDNQYAKMVDQKTNYILGKPFTIQTDSVQYEQALKLIFDKRFHRMFQNLGEDSLNGGIGWLHVYYNERGEFSFTGLAPYEVLPFWRDADHTQLDCVVRLYEVESYEGQDLKIIEKVEIYKTTGIEYYTLGEGVLIPDEETPRTEHTRRGGKGYNWERIPIIPFKYNDEEIPLICKVKSLQDALNTVISDFQNNMQEDSRNTILVLKNYDGENLSEFRHNLAQYGAVKISTVDGVAGGVDALQVQVNSDNYKSLLELLKKALIENAMGYDAKDDKLGSNANQLNILSMYSDIDLDANGMETEYQASLEDLLFFVNAHLANTGAGNFSGVDVEIIFNRDMLMNEADIINNVRNSVGILSNETLVAQHPWVDDAAAELQRVEDEKQKAFEEYKDAFSEHSPDSESPVTGHEES